MTQPRAEEVVAGRYQLKYVIGGGGMGTVWRARHCTLDTDVAVKFMSAELVGRHAGEERFRREARSAAQLRSPHIVVVHDCGMHGAQPYIVMELLEGEDLSHRLERLGRLSLRPVARIIDEVAKALTVAHAAGVIHRDLKPANLFLARVGGQELTKVLDFGIAKHEKRFSPETSSGIMLGSPSYLSPEQARGLPVDPRSDLWSLGVVAYEMLVGERPFQGANLGDIVVKICAEDPPPPSLFVRELSPAVDQFFAVALSRSASQRFGSAEELARAFSKLAAESEAEPEEPAPRAASIGRNDATSVLPGPGRLAETRPLADTLAASTAATRSGSGWRAFALGLGGLAVAAVVAVMLVATARVAPDDPPQPPLASDGARAAEPRTNPSPPAPPARPQESLLPDVPGGASAAAPPVSATPKSPAARAPARTRLTLKSKPAAQSTGSAQPVMDPRFGVQVTRPSGSADQR